MMLPRSTALFALSLAAWFAGSVCGAAEPAPVVPANLTVQPTSIDLRHQRHFHSLQVLGASADGFTLDLREQARFASADPKVAAVDERGWVRPVGSGQTQVTVTVAGQTLTVPVKVQLPAAEPPISFRHEVMAVISKAGCNAGACHGYSLGKNGFKLSLRGSDPELDYPAITKDSLSRRINPQSPAASLLVAKGRGDVPHEGGTRFRRDSLMDQILVQWIQQGAPADLADPARVVGVKLVPDKLVLVPGQKHRLQMIAQYNDGATRDATHLTVFTANSDRFAEVDEEGLVTAGEVGETAVVARFERTFAAASVVVLNPDPKFVAAPVPHR
jgi:hypothetical protein